MFRFASASTPGSKRREPSFSAASRSIVPTTRSSDALIGSSTTRMRRVATGSLPAFARSRQSMHQSSGSSGWQPKWQPSTTSCSGSSRARARTAVDFPVPFSPRISTPPIVGLIAFRTRASFICSWPTIAVNGHEYRSIAICVDDITYGARASGARIVQRVDQERPAVVRRRELEAVDLLGAGRMVVDEVVADRRLGLALRGVQAKAEDAGADARVELPREHVDRAAAAYKGAGASVRGGLDRGRAEIGRGQVGRGGKRLAGDRRFARR